MARKKTIDKLSLDMIECKKAGYGCDYGKWKAMQESKIVKSEQGIPEGWRVCEWCGKAYKPKTKRIQYYCEAYCQKEAQKERDRQKRSEYMRQYRAKRRATNG